MNDDWRLRVDVREEGLAHALSERLDAFELEHELEGSFHDRVIVSTDGPELFCYAGSREQAEAAERLIRELAAERGWVVDCRLSRWHPEAEAWEDPDVPLPASDEQRLAEHAERIEREREEARSQGYPSFEVRVECRSERDCEGFAERLRGEGYPLVRRGRFLVIGAADEDSANELAARCHREAPEGSEVVAEGTIPAVFSGSPMSPFAIFGGLGG
jgi:hypothetical protein